MLRKRYGTKQNFIARPGNGDIYSAGCQDTPLSDTFDQFVAPTQMEHINEIDVFGSIQNQVFSKRVLSVPNN